ncbi:hypothetical protein [Acidovorax sp.]|uniref:hypothetical protein n=1 Tax=Acidovorax sp. TaxID=1872122 RepID=UPI00391EFFC1
MKDEQMYDTDAMVGPDGNAEVGIGSVLAGRVRAGLPICVSGPLDDDQARAHAKMVTDLLHTTGEPVLVVHRAQHRIATPSEETEREYEAQRRAAERYLTLPIPLFAGLALAAAVFFAQVGLYIRGSEPLAMNDAFAFAMLNLVLGVSALSGVGVFVRALFRPVAGDGVALVRGFPFNEAGSAHLRLVVNKRPTIRILDLRKALRLHFHLESVHRKSKKAIELQQVRSDDAQRLTEGLERFRVQQRSLARAAGVVGAVAKDG